MNCELLIIEEDYEKIFPPISRTGKTEVKLSMKIKLFTKINELAMTFNSDFNIDLKWKDHRIRFRNLRKSDNYLNKQSREKLWLPPFYFSNTLFDKTVSSGYYISLEVLRKSEPVQNTILDADEGKIYHGRDNDLHLLAKHEPIFTCQFELSNFPFDKQVCYMVIRIPTEYRKDITIKPSILEYTGKNLISNSWVFDLIFSQ